MTKKNKDHKVISYKQDPELYFRVGLRHASKQMYGNALKFLNEAAGKEPYNADYQFNLACVLAELREVKRSNEIFLNIIKNIDPTFSECYFGIACNYFDAGDFKKAREYFEKYILSDEDGQLVEEAYDVLYYLQIYNDTGSSAKRDRTFNRLAGEGRRLMDEGAYDRASLKLEKAVEIDPEAILQRNQLSLAYFFTGKTDLAVSLANSVLKLDSSNLFAHCILCYFYAKENKPALFKEQIKALSSLEVEDIDSFEEDVAQFMSVLSGDVEMDEPAKSEIGRQLEQKREKKIASDEKKVNTLTVLRSVKENSKKKKEKQ